MEEELQGLVEEEPKYINGYKIQAGHKYRVYKFEHGKNAYYKILVPQKNYDGEVTKYYKDISFKRGIVLNNESWITPIKFYENLLPNNNDKYHPISILLITEFIEHKPEEQVKAEALDEYREKTFGSNQVNDYSREEEKFNNVEIDDEFLD